MNVFLREVGKPRCAAGEVEMLLPLQGGGREGDGSGRTHPHLDPPREGEGIDPGPSTGRGCCSPLDAEGSRRYAFLLRIASSTASAVIGMCRTRTPTAL